MRCCSSCATLTTRPARRCCAKPPCSGSTRSSRRTTRTSSSARSALGAPVIGINARDLGDFSIDRRAQLELVARAPRDRVVIAESGDPHARAGRRRRARGRRCGAGRLHADARARPRREAPRAARPPAREGVRADAPGGRRRRRRGGRRPRRVHPRRREPAPRRELLAAPDTVLRVAVFVGEQRGDRRRPRPALRARGRPPLSRRRAAPRRRAGRRRSSTCRGIEADPTHLERARCDAGARRCSPAGSAPKNVREAIDARRPVGRRLGALDRARAGRQGPRRRARVGGGRAR